MYRENTSADNTLPMILPKWGTLFTYGRAEVMRIFRSPGMGSISFFVGIVVVAISRINATIPKSSVARNGVV